MIERPFPCTSEPTPDLPAADGSRHPCKWVKVADFLPGMRRSKDKWWYAQGKLQSEKIIAKFTFPEAGTTKEIVTRLRTSFWGDGFSLGASAPDTRYFTHWMPFPDNADPQETPAGVSPQANPKV